MKLAVLAAGESSRLFADGISVPKPLVRVNGVPLIERIIDAALHAGISDICCIVNDRFTGVSDFLRTHTFPAPFTLTLLQQSTPSSMHSLFALAPHVCSAPFCLTTTDSVFREEEFNTFLAEAARCPVDGLLAITSFIDDEKPLCVDLDEQMNIIRFSDIRQGLRWATGGIYYFQPRIFDCMDEALRSGTFRLRNFLRLLLTHGYRMRGYPFSKIIDVDHAADIGVAEAWLSSESH